MGLGRAALHAAAAAGSGRIGRLRDLRRLRRAAFALPLAGDRGYLGWKSAVGAKEAPYGPFVGALLNFLVVALALRLFIVKFLGYLMKARRALVAPPPPSRQEVLLAEIRDMLKAQ